MSKLMYIILCTLFFFISKLTFAEIRIGNSFFIAASYVDFTGMSGGKTQNIELLDSILQKDDTTLFVFKTISSNNTGFFENGSFMRPLMYGSHKKNIYITSMKPLQISRLSQNLSKAKWIIGSKSDFIFYPDIQPIAEYYFIPILPDSNVFVANDTYTIRINDTTGIVWTYSSRIHFPNEYFIGKTIKYLNKMDTTGTVINDSLYSNIGKTTLFWEPNYSRPFNVSSITASSLFETLSKKRLTMGEGMYGQNFYSLTPSSPIHFRPTTNRLKHKFRTSYLDILGRKIGYEGPYSKRSKYISFQKFEDSNKFK